MVFDFNPQLPILIFLNYIFAKDVFTCHFIS